MDRSAHEEHLSQPLQTNNKQIEIAVTFLTGYNGILIATNSKNGFCFRKTITDADDFIQISIPQGAYEIESLKNEIRRIFIDNGYCSENENPFTIKPNINPLGSIIEISPQGPIISCGFNDSNRNLLGFHETILYKVYNLSPNPVDILSFDNIFLEKNIAQGMTFIGKRSGVIHDWTMTVDPGHKYVEKFVGGISSYTMESKDFVSKISLKLKNGNNDLVSFSGQSITFRLSIKEV